MNVRLHSKWNTSYDEISRLYASGKTIQDACIKAKIHPTTYYKICKALNKESIAKEIIVIQKGGTTNNSINTINKENIAKEIIATQKGGTTNNSTNTIKKTQLRDTLKQMYYDRINNRTEFNMDNYLNNIFDNKEPLSVDNKEPLSVDNKEPLSAGNKEPLSIDNKEPLSIDNKEPLSVDNKEPLSIKNKKPRKQTAKTAKATKINKI